MFTSSRKPVRSSLTLGLLALVALGIGSTEVAAQGRRASLSEDLKQKIAAGDTRPTSVILTAKRSFAALWALVAGRKVFHEKALGLRMGVLVLIVAGLVLLIR